MNESGSFLPPLTAFSLVAECAKKFLERAATPLFTALFSADSDDPFGSIVTITLSDVLDSSGARDRLE